MENDKEIGKMEGSTTVRTLEQIADQFEMGYDSRFRFWGKIVSGTDLSKKGGYALQGQFFNRGMAVAISPGAYVVVASETGSMKYHSYSFCLVQNQNGNLVQIEPHIEEIKNELPPQIYANALNNTLYAYAVRIWYNSQRPAP